MLPIIYLMNLPKCDLSQELLRRSSQVFTLLWWQIAESILKISKTFFIVIEIRNRTLRSPV